MFYQKQSAKDVLEFGSTQHTQHSPAAAPHPGPLTFSLAALPEEPQVSRCSFKWKSFPNLERQIALVRRDGAAHRAHETSIALQQQPLGAFSGHSSH